MSNSKENPVVGAVGFEIFLETRLDLSTASGITIEYTKPSGATGNFTGTADSRSAPRSNTKYGAYYITSSANDLDEAGEWAFQVSVVMPTFAGRGRTDTLEVLAAI